MVDVGAAPIDRYVVLEHLSEGGMGAIYVGKKLGAAGFEMEVVLKQLLPEFTQQEEFIDLFLREAKLSATLDHANIIHTIDLVTAGGEYFIVMEYLPGGDLRTLLKKAKRRGKRFSPSAAIHICREVLSALAYAHVKRDLEGVPLKLIHRDVSPSNILVSYAGEVKLTDFGIAKAATHNSLFYKVKGKIGYMSPEQAKSESLDHRSDLYSLAVCMFEVLTGERLFVHAGLTTSADEIYSQPVPLVSRKVPGLTADLDAIMSKALSLSPDARFQTASEFQEALTRCAHRNGLLMSTPEVARELFDLCGPPDQWRDDDDDDDLGYFARAGTEVYDGGDEEDDDEVEAPAPKGGSGGRAPSLVGVRSIQPAAAAPASPGMSDASMSMSITGRVPRQSSARLPRSRTEIAKLQGVVELTSIINMIEVENQHREAMGERPLVESDFAARPDPGIRSVDPAGRPGRGLPGVPPRRRPEPTDPQDLLPTTSRPLPGLPPNRMDSPPPLQEDGSLPPGSLSAASRTPGGLSLGSLSPGPLSASPLSIPLQPSPQPRQVPHFQAAAPSALDSQARPRRRSFLRPWMLIVAILLAAAAAGIVVAMSGPDVAVQHAR